MLVTLSSASLGIGRCQLQSTAAILTKRTSGNIPKDNRLIVAARNKHIRVWTEVDTEDDIGMPSQGFHGFSLCVMSNGPTAQL